MTAQPLPYRLSFKFVEAEDSSVDSQWEVYLDGEKTDYAIQITFGYYTVNKAHYDAEGKLEAVTFYDDEGPFKVLGAAKDYLVRLMEKEPA